MNLQIKPIAPQYTSNCCDAPITMADANGHGKCSDCKDNCVPMKVIEPDALQIAEVFLSMLNLQRSRKSKDRLTFSIKNADGEEVYDGWVSPGTDASVITCSIGKEDDLKNFSVYLYSPFHDDREAIAKEVTDCYSEYGKTA